MNLFPFISRKIGQSVLSTNEAGRFILSDDTLPQIAKKADETTNLYQTGMAYDEESDIYFNSYIFDIARRNFIPKTIDYFMIIPTLRCNLNCTYCQVSRANEDALGFDWDDQQYETFIKFFDRHSGDTPKVEIQGGEPLLVYAKLEKLILTLRKLRPSCEIVICTNLQDISDHVIKSIKKLSIFISSSLDGPLKTHDRNRTQNIASAKKFYNNLNSCINELGHEKISLLPTIVDPRIMMEVYLEYKNLGFNEIFMRPVNYQGFARKKHSSSKSIGDEWSDSYLQFLEWLFNENETSDHKISETFFSLHAKRIFKAGYNSHVDFRNPNPVAKDYVVVNFDGKLFPSDEARMLDRIGIIDLSIGDLDYGFDDKKIGQIDDLSKLENYSQCQSCAYKPFCGIDVVDLISKHGTVDVNMHETDNCKMHMRIFDFIFENIKKNNPIFMKNLNLNLTGTYTEPHLTFGNVYD